MCVQSILCWHIRLWIIFQVHHVDDDVFACANQRFGFPIADSKDMLGTDAVRLRNNWQKLRAEERSALIALYAITESCPDDRGG